MQRPILHCLAHGASESGTLSHPKYIQQNWSAHDRYVALAHLRICSGPVCRRTHARIYEIQSAHAGGYCGAASHGQRALQRGRKKPYLR